MKAVMLSIKPNWCELIASGKKTVEVRKTRPKLDTPFKCYIYCTKGGKDDILWTSGIVGKMSDKANGKPLYAWHISDLVIYDKPKELSEFGLKRPPQSWCYVEELR